MSKIEVDTIDTVTGTTTLQIGSTNVSTINLGASGDSVVVPSGVTLDVTNATVSGLSSYSDSDALSLFNASGSAPVYACRAWVNFNGSGTVAIRDSGNVSSITDNGTGDYTVNFTTAMPDANYTFVGSVSLGSAETVPRSVLFQEGDTRSVSAIQVNVKQTGSTNPANRDNAYVELAFFR